MALAPLPMTSTAPSAPSGGSDLLSNSTTSIGCPSPPPAGVAGGGGGVAPAMVSASPGANQPLNDITKPNTGLSAAQPTFAVDTIAMAAAAKAAMPSFLTM